MRWASETLTVMALVGVTGAPFIEERKPMPPSAAVLESASPGLRAPVAPRPVPPLPVASAPIAPGPETPRRSLRGPEVPAEDLEAAEQIAAIAPDRSPIAEAPRAAPRPTERSEASLCDDPRLVGRVIDPIADEEDARCAAGAPIELSEVAGVTVEPAVVTSCALAGPLADWVEKAVAPAAEAHLDQAVVEMVQVSGYVCRNRNNAAKGRISEHARGRAIDVARFRLGDGEEVVVEEDWTEEAGGGAFLRAIWKDACGHFGTVLGPDADEWHHDHFHLDAAERRRGYCR